jgi:hypothetical protein
VLVDITRFPTQQSWPTTSVYSYCKRSFDRGKPKCQDSKDIQAILWFNGYVIHFLLVSVFVFSERADVLVQLLHKLSIRGVNGSEKLLRVIKVR